MRQLEEDLAAAQAFHGHLCHGMVMGVRMARYGCRGLGIDDPPAYKDLLVYVEMDRCASDAVSVVCGVTLGRRRLKWVDYGKMAATFVDLATGRALRVAPRLEVPHAGRDR
jgi:formylmethanofuran dehydrogenase subunit E